MLSDEWQLKSRVCLTHSAKHTGSKSAEEHNARGSIPSPCWVSGFVCANLCNPSWEWRNLFSYRRIPAIAELTQIMLFKSIGEARSHFAPFTIPESCNHASFEFPNKTKYNHCGVDNKFARERLLKSSKSWHRMQWENEKDCNFPCTGGCNFLLRPFASSACISTKVVIHAARRQVGVVHVFLPPPTLDDERKSEGAGERGRQHHRYHV